MNGKRLKPLDDRTLDQVQGGIASVQDLPAETASTGDVKDDRVKSPRTSSVILLDDAGGEITR